MRSDEPDEGLMANVAKGQRGPLETLVRRYATPLLTFIQRMIGDRHRSEELFQEVFLAVWNKKHQYEFPRAFKPWLFAIALNKCRADFRKPRVITAHFAEEAVSQSEDGRAPLESMIATETAEKVALAITRLPTQQRTVVVLRIWQELSYTEIADLLQRSEGTVRSHMYHALASLRGILTAEQP